MWIVNRINERANILSPHYLVHIGYAERSTKRMKISQIISGYIKGSLQMQILAHI